MKKFKIYTTIFILYEFAVLTVLQIPKYCIDVFNMQFCNVSFKYFFMCIVIPIMLGLIAWWMPDISKLFCKKCQCETQNDNSIKTALKENIYAQDIERLITAAIIIGIQKFAAKHPKTKKTLNDILNMFEQNKK